MNRNQFYFEQPVTESELNGAFDSVEQAIWNIMRDQNLIGIAQGMNGVQASPTPNQTVLVSGPGFAYDPNGARIFTASPNEMVDLSKDSNGVVTTVSGAGNEKYISLFIHFTRALSDPRVDGNSNTIYFVENESHEYIIVQGAEAAVGTASRPALDSTSLLLFDVHRIFGQTQFLNADIDITRRQDTFVFNQTPLAIRTGTVPLAIQAMLQKLNDHINGVAGAHPATGITEAAYSNGPVSIPGSNVQAGLQALVDQLTSPAHSGTRFSLSAGTPASQLAAIQSNIDTRMTNGSDSIAQVASITALKAIGSGSRFANQVANVLDYGMYHWDPALIATSDNIFCIRPTDIVSDASPGRWCSPLRSAIQAALGIAQLDATGRVAAANTRNGLIGTFGPNNVGTGAITNTTSTISGQAVTGCAVGDLIIVLGTIDFSITSGSTGGSISSSQMGIQDPASADHFVGRSMLLGSSSLGVLTDYSDIFVYTVAAPGTHTFRFKATVGSSSTCTHNVTHFAFLIRP